MSTVTIRTSFLVEPTKYGWSVCAGTKRLGLFNTQRQALGCEKTSRRVVARQGETQHPGGERERPSATRL